MTLVSDDVAEFNSGKITIEQLGARWAARKWTPVPMAARDALSIAAWEPDDAIGPDGSWFEVDKLVAQGILSQSDCFAVSKIMQDIKAKAKMSRVLAYSDDQPRDDSGRWTSGGGGDGGGDSPSVGGSGGWKPSMTSAEAATWAKDSAIKDPIFHGTSVIAADAIKTDGFNLEHFSAGRDYGLGFYFTNKPVTTYGGMSGDRTTLTIRANVNKVATPAQTTEVLTEVAAIDGGFDQYDIDVSQVESVATAHGYDALSYISKYDLWDETPDPPLNYLIFDPTKVTVVDDATVSDNATVPDSNAGDNIYTTPIVPLSETGSDGGRDEKAMTAVGTAAMVRAYADHPSTDTLKNAIDNPALLPGLITESVVSGSVKAMVASDIANNMGSKYDAQLITGKYTAMGEYPAPGMPVDQLLGHNNVWLRRNNGSLSMSYVGTDDSKFGKEYLDGKYDATKDTVLRGDDPKTMEGLRTDTVSKLVNEWAQTSNDHSVESLAMQDAATKEFNLSGTTDRDKSMDSSYTFIENDPPFTIRTLEDHVQGEIAKNGNMYQAFLRAQYNSTQQFFKDRGITEVSAYRGFNFNEKYDANGGSVLPPWADPEHNDVEGLDDNNEGEERYVTPHWDADIPLRPLSAFSYDPDVAKNFSGSDGSDIRTVIGGQVPVSRILSTAVTGIGCLNESEMVVLGGTDKWTVT
jgi:hypothetical protein